jgi:hypothetical protein
MRTDVILGAALIAVAIVVAGLFGGRYSLSPVSPGNPNEDKTWLLDRLTGKLTLCYENAASVRCLDRTN